MIYLLVGQPGHGKSYTAVRLIVEALEEGKPVVTNVKLLDGWEYVLARRNPIRRFSSAAVERKAGEYRRLYYVSEDHADLFRVRLHGEREGRGKMVIDEVHRFLNARTWDGAVGLSKDDAIRNRLEVVRFFSAHRHYGYDVALLTQDENNLDRQVRSLFEYLVRLKNAKRFKVWGIPIFPVNVFIAIWVWNDKAKSIAKRQVYFLSKSLAALYDTHAMAEGDLPDDVFWMPR